MPRASTTLTTSPARLTRLFHTRARTRLPRPPIEAAAPFRTSGRACGASARSWGAAARRGGPAGSPRRTAEEGLWLESAAGLRRLLIAIDPSFDPDERRLPALVALLERSRLPAARRINTAAMCTQLGFTMPLHTQSTLRTHLLRAMRAHERRGERCKRASVVGVRTQVNAVKLRCLFVSVLLVQHNCLIVLRAAALVWRLHFGSVLAI